jgi:hypothetical protein
LPTAAGPFLILESESPRAELLLLGAAFSLLALLVSIPIGRALDRIPRAARPRPVVFQAAPPMPVEHHRLIQSVAAAVKQHYYDKRVAETAAEALLAHEKAGDYDSVTDGQALARLVEKHLREDSRDNHFTMEYTRNVFPDFSQPPPPEAQARYRAAMQQANCTFEKVEIRPHNVGYLKLNSFPDLPACQATATAAMSTLNHADALIFDLRDNRGGYANMVVFLAGYLFDHPEYMFNSRDAISEETWTRSPVPGSLLADKPVYILTSSRTYSGAEQFSFDLKMLKRATLIGETTGGASHSGVLHNLDDHFAVGIPETKPINPFSASDWAITGVEPDVKVKAADALDTAEKLAEAALRKK